MNQRRKVSPRTIKSPGEGKSRDACLELSEARRRIADLEAINRGLRASNRNYMEMVGFVAHQLKNALAPVVLSLYTIKDGYLGDITPAQGKSLDSMARSLEDLKDMICDYLDLTRLEQGVLEIDRNYFPLNARVVRPVLEGLEGEVQRRQMAVENGIPEGKVVWADAELLKIVYGNLLSNAVKYGRQGGMIRLGVQEDERVVTLSVCNEGSGIAPDQIPLLFRKFMRLHSPERADQRGTGLGLYICRGIVEGHGGSIWADCQMGSWVKFSFTLPKEEVR